MCLYVHFDTLKYYYETNSKEDVDNLWNNILTVYFTGHVYYGVEKTTGILARIGQGPLVGVHHPAIEGRPAEGRCSH